jgi:hypothetical protein
VRRTLQGRPDHRLEACATSAPTFLGRQGRSLVSRHHLIAKLTFLPLIFTASFLDEQRLWAKKKVSRMGRGCSRETESKQWQPLEVRGILNRRGKAPG